MKANNEFWARVEKTQHCWNWLQGAGEYGYHSQDRKQWRAHRLSVLDSGREIPPKYHVDHLCRNKRCVNPSHLDPIDSSEHGKRGWPYAHRQYWHDRLVRILNRSSHEGAVSAALAKLKSAELLVAEMDTYLRNRILEIEKELCLQESA